MKRRIYILNGPNLNLLGTREPHIYGATTLATVQSECERHAANKETIVSFFQSNDEGKLVELVQNARHKADGIIINPAGYSFHSIAILDALRTFEGPIIEVHISNIHRRDELHRHSIISTVATGVICGLGLQGYLCAIDAIVSMPASHFP
jgi:3-dehydroquinate dehydratase II